MLINILLFHLYFYAYHATFPFMGLFFYVRPIVS